jgi:hypothetical protein
MPGVNCMFRLLILVFILTVSCDTVSNQNHYKIRDLLNEFVSKNCVNNERCLIKLSSETKFDWDTLYFFDIGVESDTIVKVINQHFSDKSSYYSRKLIFTKKEKIVHIEKYIVSEIDDPIKDGDIDFQVTGSQNNYEVYNLETVFKIEIIKTDSRKFYRLHCSNC